MRVSLRRRKEEEKKQRLIWMRLGMEVIWPTGSLCGSRTFSLTSSRGFFEFSFVMNYFNCYYFLNCFEFFHFHFEIRFRY